MKERKKAQVIYDPVRLHLKEDKKKSKIHRRCKCRRFIWPMAKNRGGVITQDFAQPLAFRRTKGFLGMILE